VIFSLTDGEFSSTKPFDTLAPSSLECKNDERALPQSLPA
jgi:hypothetical protein